MTLVALPALKLGLGIADADTTEDDALTQLEAQAAAWVEAVLHRRFHEPMERIEYIDGSSLTALYLDGHMDDPDEVPAVRESFNGGDFVTITDFVRRGDMLKRVGFSVWYGTAEYEVTYNDGYVTLPADIEALIIDRVRGARASNAGSSGALTSEQIGEYKYTVDAGSVSSTTALSSQSTSTMNRWRRQLA